MTEDQIKHLVNRFLNWKLPRDTFNPDCGISFDKGPVNAHTPWPSKHEPSGTNLFDATQAEAMVRHMIEGMPAARAEPLAWDANENRSYALVEKLAAEIYDAFPFRNERGEPMPGTKPKWSPGGNSLKQDEARRIAREQLRAAGHVPA